jgi:putative ABC transport system permease protein
VFKVTIKGLLAHKRRFVSTFLAVLLGISFLTGTLVLGDTVARSFHDLLATVNSGVDGYVRRASTVDLGGSLGGQRQRGTLDDSMVGAIAAVPGVAAADGDVRSNGIELLDKSGRSMNARGRGIPAQGSSWRTDARMNPFRLAAGRAPAGPDEVVIDRASADKGHYDIGDRITILLPERQTFVISGIATFGSQDNRGGGADALFTLATAERLIGAPGKVNAVVARAKPGVSQTELVARIERVLPPTAEALTGTAIVKETQDTFQQRISGFTKFLSSFAFVAVLVGGFVIYNTFSILVAQRTREMALLRAVGATRRQVLASVLAEAFAVAVAGSAIGVLSGIGVGGALRSLFRSGGFPFPPGGLVLSTATVLTALVVGLLVTTVATVGPAVRASRIPPIAALREAAVDTSTSSRARLVAGICVTVLGVVLVLTGVAGKRATPIGFGAALALIGSLLLGPFVAVPVTRVLGSPAARAKGITGELARQNAIRNPRRTSGTAAALLVGVAVVSFFTIIAASLQATTSDQIDKTFVGDVAVTTTGFRFAGGLDPALAPKVAQLPEVAAAAPVRFSPVQIANRAEDALATDITAMTKVVKVDVASGSLAAMTGDTVAVSEDEAKTLDVTTGGTVTVTYPDSGPHPFTVGAIYKTNEVLDAPVVIPTRVDDAYATRPRDVQILVKFRSGVPFAGGRAAVTAAIAGNPNATVQDQHDIKQDYTGRINSFLAIIFAMLAFAIFIALMGISNTLQLSVYERTRELGLLRAVGSTRSQLRSMVRWEATIIALFGTVGGVLLGTAFGWAIVRGLGRDNNLLFDVPVARLVVIVVVGGIAGVVAAWRPAARAARLNVLEAIATE